MDNFGMNRKNLTEDILNGNLSIETFVQELILDNRELNTKNKLLQLELYKHKEELRSSQFQQREQERLRNERKERKREAREAQYNELAFVNADIESEHDDDADYDQEEEQNKRRRLRHERRENR
jgi:hypothetical protein